MTIVYVQHTAQHSIGNHTQSSAQYCANNGANIPENIISGSLLKQI